MKKAKLSGKVEANVKVLHPDDHSHITQQSPMDADRKAVSEYSDWEKGRKGKGAK
jgi:hypothetical protein